MEKTNKILSIVEIVLFAVSVILIVSLFRSIDTPGMDAWVNTNLSWAYVLFGFATVAALLFSIFQTFHDKKSAMKGLSALGLLAVVVLISYSLATSAIPQFYGVEKFVQNGVLTPTSSQWIGASLYVMYILFGGAILSIVYSSLSRIWK